VLLFDEIEKAHRDVWGVFLQILEDGTLTDAQGRRVDLSNTVVVLTSNVGAGRITSKVGRLGFSDRVGGETKSPEELKDLVLDEVKRVFRPEFLNRLDEILVFRQLEREQIAQIAGRMLSDVRRRLEARGVGLDFTDAAVDALAAAGFDPAYGARPLRRAIRAQVEDPLAQLLLDGGLTQGDTALVDAHQGTVTVGKQEIP
jgi:ATP-dependent Clp protease ATP-binding subunit ClpC